MSVRGEAKPSRLRASVDAAALIGVGVRATGMRLLESCIKTTESASARLVRSRLEYGQMAVIITSGPGLAHYWHIDGFPLTAAPVLYMRRRRRWRSHERGSQISALVKFLAGLGLVLAVVVGWCIGATRGLPGQPRP